MLRTLVAKEIHQNLLNMRFVAVCFATTLLTVGCAAISISSWLTRTREYSLNRDLNDRSLRESAADSWMAEFRSVALRKPVLMAMFAGGGERDAETRGLISNRQLPRLSVELKRSPLGNLYPPADLAFIVGVVLSLLVILLTYDCISGEREKGTLKLLLAAPVPRDTLILSKWLGGLICLLSPLAVSMIAVAIILALVPDLGLNTASWVTVAASSTLYMLYIAVVFSMALMVSVLLPSSGASVLCLLLVWLVSVLLVPGSAGQIARMARNPPGMQTCLIESQRRAVSVFIHDRETVRRDSLAYIQHVGISWDKDHTDEQRKIAGMYRLQISNSRYNRALDGIMTLGQEMLRDEERVEHLARAVMRVSPFGCMQGACEALAGTGFAHEAALRRSYEAYGRAVWETAAQYRVKNDTQAYPGDILPVYAPPRERLNEGLTDVIVDTGILCLMGLLFFLVAHRAFLRMDIT